MATTILRLSDMAANTDNNNKQAAAAATDDTSNKRKRRTTAVDNVVTTKKATHPSPIVENPRDTSSPPQQHTQISPDKRPRVSQSFASMEVKQYLLKSFDNILRISKNGSLEQIPGVRLSTIGNAVFNCIGCILACSYKNKYAIYKRDLRFKIEQSESAADTHLFNLDGEEELSNECKFLQASFNELRQQVTLLPDEQQISRVDISDLDRLIQTINSKYPILLSPRQSEILQGAKNRAYNELFSDCTFKKYQDMKDYILKCSGILSCLMDIYMLSYDVSLHDNSTKPVDMMIHSMKIIYEKIQKIL